MKTFDKKEIIIWLLFSLLIIFQFLDIWQTYLLLETGVIHEANPIMKYFFKEFGFWKSCIVIKLIVMLFLGVIIKLYIREIEERKNNDNR